MPVPTASPAVANTIGIGFGDGHDLEHVPVPEQDADEGVRKELQPALHYGVEYRLSIGGRVADDV